MKRSLTSKGEYSPSNFKINFFPYMNLTPQFSIKIRLRKIKNSHIQSTLSKCLTCIARACGAQIVSWPEPRGDAGTQAGTMEMKRSGEEYFTGITEHEDPRAHTMLLHRVNKEILSEVERSLQDAMQVCHNVHWDPQLISGLEPLN